MRYRIVVADAEKTNAFELARYEQAFIKAGANPLRTRALAKERAPVREKGFVHAEMNVECPDGFKNCRNCGDPAFKESCERDGHCPNCGITHGITPDSVLKANGFILEEVR